MGSGQKADIDKRPTETKSRQTKGRRGQKAE